MYNIKIPLGASTILDTLGKQGFEAYVVGGCVRDSLLWLTPKDWDICTAATPQEVESCFDGYRIIETGLKHGTVTVVMDDGQYEVTTFRTDGVYSDNRRPDSVEFVKDIREDLARRDFTVNAMAYNPSLGLVDPFGGQSDLAAGRISCVGNADDRFNEDALRVMRALRFASVYGFTIADETADAVHRNAGLLNNIAVERINTELCKLLCGKGCLDLLLNYSDVITTIIPELKPCVGFDQNNRYHQYTIYDHIAHAVSNYTGADVTTKVALLLHDIGKPQCYTEDENGGHFYGHGIPGKEIAEQVVDRLRFDSVTQKDVAELVLFHDSLIEPTPKAVRRWLNKVGETQLYRLLDMHTADALAHTAGMQQSRVDKCVEIRKIVDDILASEQCFSLKHLDINGKDIISLGVPEGKVVGAILQELLCQVIDEQVANEREALIQKAKEMIK